jgi:hypothetical protein
VLCAPRWLFRIAVGAYADAANEAGRFISALTLAIRMEGTPTAHYSIT